MNTYAVGIRVFERCNPVERRAIAEAAGFARVDTVEEAREFAIELVNERFGESVDCEVLVKPITEVMG
ncbi:hypothetical protein SEA_ALEEMILY_149 [Gordonia phage Aleemily]|uniref:Uncharacterized protein n=2 Tax=Cafassovirus TaxID=3425056 RepID=A0A9E7TYF8_9CAUD|nr:hypothetical protein SEA_CAFASSO_151 [Gordonia phage Cafasso]UVK59889.1 hypothetical protein SEA_ALEEMILY_149 [Gordonia phage Aleemily]